LTRSKAVTVAVQLGAAAAVGIVVLPLVVALVVVTAFARHGGASAVVVLVGAAGSLAYLFAVVTATREVAALGATAAGRVL